MSLSGMPPTAVTAVGDISLPSQNEPLGTSKPRLATEHLIPPGRSGAARLFFEIEQVYGDQTRPGALRIIPGIDRSRLQ